MMEPDFSTSTTRECLVVVAGVDSPALWIEAPDASSRNLLALATTGCCDEPDCPGTIVQFRVTPAVQHTMELHSPSWSHPRILLCSDSDGVLRVDDREGIDHILAMEEDEDVWPTTSDGAVIAESLIANSGY